MKEPDIREIRLHPCSPEGAKKALENFFSGYMVPGGGIDLRIEDARSIWGRRIVLVYDWDDMS